MKVNINELNKRIKLIKIEYEQDRDGFEIEKKTTIHECWAKINNVSGTELIKANAEFNEVKVRFLIRYIKKPIDTDMIVEFDNKLYDIVYINDYNYSHEYIEIITKLRELV